MHIAHSRRDTPGRPTGWELARQQAAGWRVEAFPWPGVAAPLRHCQLHGVQVALLAMPCSNLICAGRQRCAAHNMDCVVCPVVAVGAFVLLRGRHAICIM
jgi:hypothetical protein